jgi:hypothetical protein
MLKQITDHRNFSPVIAILWGSVIVLMIYNTYLSIKVNKALIKEKEIQ